MKRHNLTVSLFLSERFVGRSFLNFFFENLKLTMLLIVVLLFSMIMTSSSSSLTVETSSSSSVTVETSLGSLLANRLDNGVVEALNVPFAMPPVGDLRFSRPRQVKPWAPNVLDARRYGPMCPQRTPSKPIDEDCLQLNIWTPSIEKNSSLPVYVWAFGGGLVSGSGINFNGTKLSSTYNIIVVTINYRLGALGTYASMEIAEENDGATGALNTVLDILQACTWVKNHIASFGGNPENIVLGGESSGSVSSSILAFSNLTDSILSGLILESGVSTGPWFGPNYTVSESLEISQMFAEELVGDVQNESVLSRLRSLDVSEIVNSSSFETLNYAVDSYLIRENRPRDLPLLFRGNVLIGGNSGDTTCRAAGASPAAPTTHEALHKLLESYFFEDTDFLLAPYNNTLSSPEEIFFQMSRDVGVICPASRFSTRVLKAGGNAFMYLFSYNATGPSVYHGGEVHCIFQDVRSVRS